MWFTSFCQVLKKMHIIENWFFFSAWRCSTQFATHSAAAATCCSLEPYCLKRRIYTAHELNGPAVRGCVNSVSGIRVFRTKRPGSQSTRNRSWRVTINVWCNYVKNCSRSVQFVTCAVNDEPSILVTAIATRYTLTNVKLVDEGSMGELLQCWYRDARHGQLPAHHHHCTHITQPIITRST